MHYSATTKEIFAALSAMQREVKNAPATAENLFLKNKYTPLSEMLNHVRPFLANNGLAVIQSPCSSENGVGVITTLVHKSGEFVQSEPFYLRPMKNDPQAGGSAITYARRYALAAMLGIASDVDDDGSRASKNGDEPAKAKPLTQEKLPAKPKPPIVLCPKCGKEVAAAKGKTGTLTKPADVLKKLKMCSHCYKDERAKTGETTNSSGEVYTTK